MRQSLLLIMIISFCILTSCSKKVTTPTNKEYYQKYPEDKIMPWFDNIEKKIFIEGQDTLVFLFSEEKDKFYAAILNGNSDPSYKLKVYRSGYNWKYQEPFIAVTESYLPDSELTDSLYKELCYLSYMRYSDRGQKGINLEKIKDLIFLKIKNNNDPIYKKTVINMTAEMNKLIE